MNTIESMRYQICRAFGITPEALNSQSRAANIVAARVTVSQAAWKLYGLSTPEAGRFAGWASHGQVWHWSDRFASGELDRYPISKMYRELINKEPT